VEPSAQECRAHRRYAYGYPVTYQAIETGAPPTELQSQADILDLSDGGLAIRTAGGGVEIGSVVKVWLPIAGYAVRVPVLTVTTWVHQDPDGCRLGLRFLL
jgi:hypothetical protein